MDSVTMSRDEAAEALHTLSTSAQNAVRAPADLADLVLRRARRRRRLRHTSVALGVTVFVLATAAAVSLGRGDYFTVTQPSAVMAPTIGVGERVIFSKIASPGAGDVVYAQVSQQGNEFDLLSRVMALSGDTVSCPAQSDGHCAGVVVNGTRVADPYLQGLVTEPFAPTTVPDGEVFVMGDARDIANDSRLLGPIPVEAISGVAVEIVSGDGDPRHVPGAPERRGPGDDQIIDPPNEVPPASAVPT